ncbi:MAG: amino acid ABC transporter permease [Peptostreptococcaceae bacterium]|nr:amino acid ABC transporter permease [Peptostreptococcaceae bacterium]
MNLDFLIKYKMFYISGVANTLLLAIFAVFFGVILGVMLALMKISKKTILRAIATAYIEFLRGTPVIIQIYIIFYGLPRVIPLDLPDMVWGIIALSLNSGAYVAEIIRAGIQAVDKGQMEAARSIGMPFNMGMRYIVIPQAFKNILPALGNEFIVVVKESAIVSVVGITELMYRADTIRGITYQAFAPLMVAAVIYFIITFTLSRLLGIVERRMSASD